MSSELPLSTQAWADCWSGAIPHIAGYFRGVYISREHSQSSNIKIVNVEEARFSISTREIFANKNWIGCSRNINTSNNPLYGTATWTCRAAGRPPCQVGRKMSACLDIDSGIKPLVSRAGLRAADWAISATAYMVISELIGNSVTCGAAVGWVMERIPSQYLKQQRNSLSCMCSIRGNPACGRAVHGVGYGFGSDG